MRVVDIFAEVVIRGVGGGTREVAANLESCLASTTVASLAPGPALDGENSETLLGGWKGSIYRLAFATHSIARDF